jgi:DNA-binding response OmpR family regulator
VRILIVEDDERLLRLLRRILEEEGHMTDAAFDGVEGKRQALGGAFDLIVLDVMLPRLDGVALCRELRQAHIATPILMLTARDTVADRVRGLDAGADDYLVKPFATAELLARVRALERRRIAEVADARLVADGLEMNLVRHEVERDGRPIDLTPREYALLEYFLRNHGQVLTRPQIMAAVWRFDTDLASNVVDLYVHYLRDKIDRKFDRKLLHTVRGVGYVLRI